MSLLQWLDPSQVNVPTFFDTMRNRNETFAGQDITALVERAGYNDMVECLVDVIQVGFVDSISIGCVASDIVLYLMLVFILGAVSIKFFMALYFGWFMSWKLGNFKNVSYADKMKRAAEVEQWSDDIYRAAPANMRPNAKGNRKTVFLPTTSRFSKAEPMLVNSRPATAYSMADQKRTNQPSMYGNRLTPGGFHNSPPDSPMLRNSRSSTSLPFRDESGYSLSDQTHQANPYGCPFPLANVVPQPAPDFRPFEFDLVHSICLVTAYSESYAGLRTTLDSLATTDYPNSHKMILVVCDGIVRGSDSKTNESTHEIVLSMMKELIVHPDDAEKYSCLAIADGGKRENKAIVYAGFYNYDNDTVEERKQQRVPMVLVAKVGNDDEMRAYQQAGRGKPGNRGKRDSQIILMSFLQKVIFDERMTQFEYEFFNAIWRVCGVPPDKFETVLCVDADTKVFPDSLTRMNACLVHDPDIMGLCGETKIANKKESWVTMIQGTSTNLFRADNSVRILHLSPLVQGFRVRIRWCHLSTWMFLYLPNQGAQGRTWILGPYSRQPRYCRALFRKRRRHTPQKESTATRRGPIPLHAHAQDIPETKNDVLSPGRLQDPSPRTIPYFAFAATTMDQLDRP